MAKFSVERVVSRPFGFWDFASIVENRGSCEETVWYSTQGCEEEPEMEMGGHLV